MKLWLVVITSRIERWVLFVKLQGNNLQHHAVLQQLSYDVPHIFPASLIQL